MNFLSSSFYQRDTVIVAKDLMGKILVREYQGLLLKGIITETEAYRGQDDLASHAYRGITKRNHAMFGPVGYAYIYFIYGTHFCLNVVARKENQKAGAVLIRAIEPIENIEVMLKLRNKIEHAQLANGPGKLTQALAITRTHNDIDMKKQGELYIINGDSKKPIKASKRIGITKNIDKLWRFSFD
ncbi:MAG: DNA-3-methyladenine glycosylase [Candidatus Babeliales bacterium]